MAKKSWKEWSPGLDNQQQTLGDVLKTLPGNNAGSINFWVRLFENPNSPIAFPGAISLERHDCMHILLGRGLLSQDEAFVIGFTMGTSPDINNFQTWLFKAFTEYLYPKPYNFTKDDLLIFDLALNAAKDFAIQAIYDFPFEDHTNRTLAELRSKLNIDIQQLKNLYRQEQDLLPDSFCSKRLPL